MARISKILLFERNFENFVFPIWILKTYFVSGLICLIGPVLLTLYGNDIFNDSEQKLLDPEVHYSKESVLILTDVNDIRKVFSTSGSQSLSGS